jgi:2'-5' RNA ligase
MFVGVELSDAARELAADNAGLLRRRLGKTLDARWVPPENMHVTVRFIGYVADEKVPGLLEALTQSLDVGPFEIELDGCGRFPPHGAPRVLWIGVTQGLRSLAALHEEFNRRVAPFGYEPDGRPYSAHLTLARIKDARSAAAKSVDTVFESIRAATVKLQVDAVTVFESRLSPQGASYIPVHRIPLRR